VSNNVTSSAAHRRNGEKSTLDSRGIEISKLRDIEYTRVIGRRYMRFDRTSNLVGHFPTSLLATRLFSANTLNVRYIHKILKKEKDPGPIHAIPERHEATTLGKAKLPYDGRNISARVCKAAFRQKLGSIAVREFRPVICNCRAAHYNSPFLASELPPRTIPRALVLLPSRVRLVSATGATEDSAVGAFSLSLSLSLSLIFRVSSPSSLAARARA